jgi:hypothetical protein
MTMQIVNLSKTYGNGVEALKHVNLTIGSGLFGMLGPAGDMIVNVWYDSRPQGFEPVYPELEDVYFATIKGFFTAAYTLRSSLPHEALDCQPPVGCASRSPQS